MHVVRKLLEIKAQSDTVATVARAAMMLAEAIVFVGILIKWLSAFLLLLLQLRAD
jgi:hypothetical protein